MTPEAFAELVSPAAQRVRAATGLPVSFLIGQWAHETGWGESSAATIDHNFAGLKPWWGEARPGVTGYNRYADLVDWANGYADFVRRNDLYRPALEAAAAGRSTFEVADLMAPWVGQPGQIDQLTGTVIATGYGAAIAALIRGSDLTRYDFGVATLDPADVETALRAPGGYADKLERDELGPMKLELEEYRTRLGALETITDNRTDDLIRRIGARLVSAFTPPGP